ncbi:hypothetical protein [Xylanibacter ruminicola]|uniref:hypothetical protein n=1 Tax=Xylanibacter ruminicola TaxID=839 RepID=UPI0004915C0A|nr:hypothetical protein [Xylanibacter ruminicola]
MISDHDIRPKYEALVTRYEGEKNKAKKVMLKHKFIAWLIEHHSELTTAELEYLQTGITYVEDVNF